MKRALLTLISVGVLLYAEEKDVEFTPNLLIEAGGSQELQSDAKAGALYIDKMEAGFELTFKERLLAHTGVEVGDNDAIGLNEAFMTYIFNEIISLSGGKLVNNFGDFSSEAISDPLIQEFAETKLPAIQLDATGEVIYGGLTIFQGESSNNFKAFVPSLGLNINNVFGIKFSSRIEDLADVTYSDLTPILACEFKFEY